MKLALFINILLDIDTFYDFIIFASTKYYNVLKVLLLIEILSNLDKLEVFKNEIVKLQLLIYKLLTYVLRLLPPISVSIKFYLSLRYSTRFISILISNESILKLSIIKLK